MPVASKPNAVCNHGASVSSRPYIPTMNPSAIATTPTNRAIIPLMRKLMGAGSWCIAIVRVRYTGSRCRFNRTLARSFSVLRPLGGRIPTPAMTGCLPCVGLPDRFPLRCAPPQETSIPRPRTGLIIQPTALPPTPTLTSAAGTQTIAREKDAECEHARPLHRAPNRSTIDSAG
jgi:hypothetical protein